MQDNAHNRSSGQRSTRATAAREVACTQQRALGVTGSSSRQRNCSEIILFGSPALDASVQGHKLGISSLNEIEQTNFVSRRTMKISALPRSAARKLDSQQIQ